jgi:hypothetical protein
LPTQSAMVGYCKVMAYSQSRLRGGLSYRQTFPGHITQSAVLMVYGNKGEFGDEWEDLVAAFRPALKNAGQGKKSLSKNAIYCRKIE